MAHLAVMHRQDAILAGAPVKPRNPVLVDVEVLAHQLAQQRVGVLDRFLR